MEYRRSSIVPMFNPTELKVAALRVRQRVRAERSFRDEFRHQMKPVLVVLKGVGVLPIQDGRHRGHVHHRKFSEVMVYSVTLYLVVITGVFFVHYEEVKDLDGKRFDEKIQAMLNTTFDLLVVLLPFFSWGEAGPIAGYLSRWAELQIQYLQATGKPIRYSTRRRAEVMSVAVVVSGVVFEMLYSYQAEGSFKYLELFTSIYQDVLRNFLAVFWHLVCRALVTVSWELEQSFVEEMSDSGAHRVAEYRLAWLHLSHLARGLGDAACYTYGFYVSYLFVTLILSVYEAVVNIKEVHEKSVSLIEAVVIGWCLYLVCDGACQVANRVGVRWENLLLSIKSTNNPTQQMQLDEFLAACALSPPVMSLGSYVTVDRTLLISLASAMATYLVVLVQFKMSDRTEIRDGPTETNVTAVQLDDG